MPRVPGRARAAHRLARGAGAPLGGGRVAGTGRGRADGHRGPGRARPRRGRVRAHRPHRRPRPDEPDRPRTLTVGVDVGATKILGGVVDEAGTVVEELRVQSPATRRRGDRDRHRAVWSAAGGRHEVAAVGIGAAGYIDKTRSTRDVRAQPGLARPRPACGARGAGDLPVVVENDANAAAWGEFSFGAGEDVDDLLLVTVGTGVGGGVVLDGRLLPRGLRRRPARSATCGWCQTGMLCGCGNRGCWRPYGSGTALVREARAAAAAGSSAARELLDRAGGDPAAITGPLITECAQAGDPFCPRAARRPRHLAGRGHRLARRRAGPGGRGHRRRRQRGRRPAARPDPRRRSAASSPGAATDRSPRSARPRWASAPA